MWSYSNVYPVIISTAINLLRYFSLFLETLLEANSWSYLMAMGSFSLCTAQNFLWHSLFSGISNFGNKFSTKKIFKLLSGWGLLFKYATTFPIFHSRLKSDQKKQKRFGMQQLYEFLLRSHQITCHFTLWSSRKLKCVNKAAFCGP